MVRFFELVVQFDGHWDLAGAHVLVVYLYGHRRWVVVWVYYSQVGDDYELYLVAECFFIEIDQRSFKGTEFAAEQFERGFGSEACTLLSID